MIRFVKAIVQIKVFSCKSIRSHLIDVKHEFRIFLRSRAWLRITMETFITADKQPIVIDWGDAYVKVYFKRAVLHVFMKYHE